ncbi:YceI family protein [Saccharicrinis sp. 156]|uniref:YceI family protein n=1 Tax=Saccharicrinis sp. 156 TaxID=3417574 RepID=UPI003D34C19D
MKKRIAALIIFLTCISSSIVIGQTSYQLDLENSSLTVKGTSTIHDWEMNVEKFKGQMVLADEDIHGLMSGSLAVEVNSIKSNHKLMNKKAYEALKEDEFPQIVVDVIQVSNQSSKGNAKVVITIAGKKREITEEFLIIYLENGGIEIKGELHLKMSDFDVDAPVAMMGTIKTGNEVQVAYSFVYKKS